MKKLLYIVGACAVILTACTAQDDNYIDFLNEIPVYSPRIDSISAEVVELGSIMVYWVNPKSERAVSATVSIVGEDIPPVTKAINRSSTSLLDSVEFKDLPLKGLEFRIITTDIDNNTSTPVSTNAIPIPQ